MAVFAVLSGGGSPGVTTSALALTLSWPSQVILAECDPSGGDILAGLLGGHVPASSGLLPLALEAGAGAEVAADTLWRHLIELDEEHNRLLLAGVTDPRQSAGLASSLPWIADALQAMQADVIADCGRLDTVAAMRPVLAVARLAVLVLRPTLRQVSRAIPRIEMLADLVGRERVVALLVGEGTASSREVAKTLGVAVAGQLPADEKTAGVLSDGSGSRRRLEARPLIRAATVAGRTLRDAAAAAGPRLGYPEQADYPEAPVFAQHSFQPALSQPALSQPDFSQPDLSRPDLRQPDPSQPAPSQPAVQPDLSWLDVSPAEPAQPDPGPPGRDPADVSWPGDLPADSSWPQYLPPGFGQPARRPPGFGQPPSDRPDDAQHGRAQNGSHP